MSRALALLLPLIVLGLPSVADAAVAAVNVPEPATGLLIAAGIGAGIAALRRRRNKQ
jgi:hypothetical protein